MATIFVFLTDSAGSPITGASPTFDFWDKSSPAAPQSTGVAMTELVGGIGGGYFADVATTDGREYLAIVDGTASASPRYQVVAFSGETDARVETDVPAILADTAAMQPLVDVATSTRSSHSAADVDTTLSGTHGAGSWVGTALTATQDERLRRIWKQLGNDPLNAVTHRKATVGVPGFIRSADTEVDIEVDQVDADNVTLTQQ